MAKWRLRHCVETKELYTIIQLFGRNLQRGLTRLQASWNTILHTGRLRSPAAHRILPCAMSIRDEGDCLIHSLLSRIPGIFRKENTKRNRPDDLRENGAVELFVGS